MGCTAHSAGLFYRQNINNGSARWVSMDSAGQLQALPATLVVLTAATAPDVNNAYQINGADITLTNTAMSIFGLVANPSAATRTLNLAADGTLTLNGILGVNNAAGRTTVINPGTGTSNLIIGSERNLVINMDTGNGVTINAPIADNGGGASSVTVASTMQSGTPGTVIFAGANTYTGDTYLLNGTLQGTTASTSLTPPSPFSTSALQLHGGTLQLRASGTEDTTAETITFGNNTTIHGSTTISVNRQGATSTTKTIALGTLSIGAQTLTVAGGNSYGLEFGATTLTGDANFTTNVALTLGAVGESGGSRTLTKNGSSTLTLTSPGTYTGSTTINAGTLVIGGDARLGTAPGSPTPGHLVLDGGTLQTTNITLNVNRGVLIGANNGTFHVPASGDTLIYNGIATGPGALTKTGIGTLRLGGNNSFNGFILGTGVTNSSTTGTASGSSGGFVLVGHNNALGTGIIDSRGAQIRASTTGIVIGNDIVVGPTGGGLRLGGSNDFEISGDIAINTSTRGVGNYGAGTTITLSGTIDLSGTTTVSGASAMNFEAGNTANFGAKFIVTGPILGSPTIGGISTANTFDGSEVTLANPNSTFDSLTLNTGTMLVAQFGNKADAAGYLGTTDAINFATGGATLRHTGAAETSDKDITLTAAGAIDSSGGGVTVSGLISGAGALTKRGTSTLTLTNANNYAGNTIVNDGTLAVTGSLLNNGPAQNLVATPDTTLTGNPILKRRVPNASSYTLGSATGLGSTAVSMDPEVLNVSMNTTAAILNGTATGQADVSMSWRARNAVEAAPTNTNAVLSNVLNLTGIFDTGTPGDGILDQFVLQMSYTNAALGSLNEMSIATSGELRLGWNDGGVWKTAALGNNSGTGTGTFVGAVAYDPGNPLHNVLGAYGVDPSSSMGGVVWAVLNHNSEFAVIPEPSTLVLGSLALLGLAGAGLRRRRQRLVSI